MCVDPQDVDVLNALHNDGGSVALTSLEVDRSYPILRVHHAATKFGTRLVAVILMDNNQYASVFLPQRFASFNGSFNKVNGQSLALKFCGLKTSNKGFKYAAVQFKKM